MAVMRPRLSFNPGVVHYPGVRQRCRRALGSLPEGIALGSHIVRGGPRRIRDGSAAVFHLRGGWKSARQTRLIVAYPDCCAAPPYHDGVRPLRSTIAALHSRANREDLIAPARNGRPSR
jgi:hypothetical protein